MRKTLVLIFLFSFLLTGCMTHMHVVGEGAKQGIVETERQWYALWGLIPINKVDTKEMAKGATNYTIKTEQNALDIIINLATSFVTVYSRTVEVRR